MIDNAPITKLKGAFDVPFQVLLDDDFASVYIFIYGYMKQVNALCKT